MLIILTLLVSTAATQPVPPPDGGAAICGQAIEKIGLLPVGSAPDSLAPGGPVPIVPSFGWSADARSQALAVSKIIQESAESAPKDAGKIPGASPKARDPAVLLPDCREAPRPRRKRRLSDYPMA